MIGNRELASLIVLMLLGVWWVFATRRNRKARQDLAEGILDVLRAAATPKVLAPIGLLLLSATFSILIASQLGLWTAALIGDAVVIILFTALPLMVTAVEAASGSALLQATWRRAVGWAAFAALYVNLKPFPLWVELILQVAAFLLAFLTLAPLARTSGRSGGCLSAVGRIGLAIIGVSTVGWTTVQLANDWEEIDQRLLFMQVLLVIWLPFSVLPFLYALAFLSRIESITLRQGILGTRLALRERCALAIGLRGSVRLASKFSEGRQPQLGGKGYLGILRRISDFRHEVDRDDAMARDRAAHAEAMAGVIGQDTDGSQLDRREYGPTKTALDRLHAVQGNWALRNDGSFMPKDQVEDTLRWLARGGLPTPDQVSTSQEGDTSHWYAWRRMPNGHVLGIGATDGHSRFLFAGSSPPQGGPGSADEWCDGVFTETPADWLREDPNEHR